jgi:uncharacterized protein (TIGR02466 family)
MMINHFEMRNLWPTPILKTRVDLPHEEIANHVREKFSGWDEYTSFYNSEFNDHITNSMPYRSQMRRAMVAGGDLFLKERNYGVPEEKLSFWFSVYDKNDDHCLHTHPNTLIAGTYYPYADEHSAPIRFRSPNLVTQMHSEPRIEPDGLFHNHHPSTGDMLFWPAWLEHEVRPQKEVEDGKTRIAISFNFGRC